MEQGSARKFLNDLLQNIEAIREFTDCLDPKYQSIKNCEELAFLLGVEAEVITKCKLNYDSPTVKLFEYLKITKPDFTIDELKKTFIKIKRHDIKRKIDSDLELTGDSKVVDVITNSTSDLLDGIALKLDSATRPVCSWFEFGLELGIQRDTLYQFEMYVNYNPTENLFRCVYSTSKETLKLNTLLGFFEDMDRSDILNQEEVIKAQSEQDTSTLDAQDVFKLGSKLLDKTSQLLNSDTAGARGRRQLAQLFEENKYIDIPNLISTLEPPRQHEIHSPTKKAIEWIAASKPEFTVGHLIGACESIKREDAVDVLLKHFPTCTSRILEGIASPHDQLKYSIQETPKQAEHILLGNTCSFGLPESKTEIIGREKEIKSLVSDLTGDYQLLVLHGSPGIGKDTIAVAAAHELIKSGDICVHVTSDGILSVDDLAVKILTTCGFQNPSCKKSREQVKALFKEVGHTRPNKCVLILQNFDHMFHSSSGVDKSVRESQSAQIDISSSTQAAGSNSMPTSNSESLLTSNEDSMKEKENYHEFLENLLLSAPNLKVVITTWESFASTRVKTKQVEVPSLESPEDSKLLLGKCKSALGIDPSSISEDCLKCVLEFCDGNPQLLQNAVVVFTDFGASAGAEQLVRSPQKDKLDTLCPPELPLQSRVNRRLQICFDWLDKNSQKVLVMMTVFPGSFRVKDAHEVFQKDLEEFDLRNILNKLKKFSFVLHCERHDSYCLPPGIKSFAVNVATPSSSSPYQNDDQARLVEFTKTYNSSLHKFINFTFNKIKEVEEKFFSTQSKEAIQQYKQQVKNLKEIANWCISGQLVSSDLDLIKNTINSFVECYLVNVKLMQTHVLKNILHEFSEICQRITSQKLHIKCLIYGGVTSIMDCLCVPQFCITAQNNALQCFGRAIKEICGSSQYSNFPSLDKQLKSICKCDAISEEACAQLLVNYGKCLVRQGRQDFGLEFIRKGIYLRKKALKTSSSPRGQVMVTVGYNDLASAYSYIGQYRSAIDLLEKRILPVYQKYLGIHPFTASALSHLAHDFLAVDRCDEALNCCETALKYRDALLGIHSETARSLFDMGRIIRKQASKCEDPDEKKNKLEKALEYLNTSLEMRHSLANLPKETVNTLSEMVDVFTHLERHEEADRLMKEIEDLCKKQLTFLVEN